jgi:hypothetical protein
MGAARFSAKGAAAARMVLHQASGAEAVAMDHPAQEVRTVAITALTLELLSQDQVMIVMEAKAVAAIFPAF